MKHIHNLRPLALAFILVVTGIAAAVCGLVMKGQLQKYVGGYDDKWAVAVPFLMLRDDTDWQRMLAAKNAPAPDPQPDPEPEPEPEPDPEPEPQPPVVVTNAVYGQDESFFDDALFIGDSRMVNVANYARLGNADYFADVGMTVFKMFSTTASDKDFGATDLASLLRSREYSHIFIMLGLNEAGYPLGNLFDAYQEDLDQLRQLQPNATIYILKVYGVTADIAAGNPSFAHSRLTAVNKGFADLPTAAASAAWTRTSCSAAATASCCRNTPATASTPMANTLISSPSGCVSRSPRENNRRRMNKTDREARPPASAGGRALGFGYRLPGKRGMEAKPRCSSSSEGTRSVIRPSLYWP